MFVTQSLGLLLGTIVMVPKTAQTIASVVMLTFVLTGGYFVTDIPVWIGWLSEFWSPCMLVCDCCVAAALLAYCFMFPSSSVFVY